MIPKDIRNQFKMEAYSSVQKVSKIGGNWGQMRDFGGLWKSYLTIIFEKSCNKLKDLRKSTKNDYESPALNQTELQALINRK